MRFFNNEREARTVIAEIIRPIYGSANLFVAERNPQGIGLREVLFIAEVKKDDEKANQLINALFQSQVSQSERLEWQGSKMDFLHEKEHEYFMIKVVVENA